jgi:hypothetical protein
VILHELARLHAWAGTSRIPEVRARVPALARLPVTRASAMLALFVAGVDVPRALLREDLSAIRELVEIIGDRVHARVAILALGRALVVCDRADARAEPELVCWPDDSSFHLLAAIPAHVARSTWLDLGCGSLVGRMWTTGGARRFVASDLNPRALRYAALGAALSEMAPLELVCGDLATVPADLITCNAPIPETAGPLWAATDRDFVGRLVAAARAALVPGGMIIIHAALDALLREDLGGELVIVAYTPAGAPREFAIAWWQPDAAPRHVRARRALTVDRPHLDHGDREAALAGVLVPL